MGSGGPVSRGAGEDSAEQALELGRSEGKAPPGKNTGRHRERDARPWRRTRDGESLADPGGAVPSHERSGSHARTGGIVRTAADLATLEPPHVPVVPAADVRDRYKFPEEFPEGPYGMLPDRPVGEANGRSHRGQRAISNEADQFAFEEYRYDLDYDPVVGSRGDKLPESEARKIPDEAAPDVGVPTREDPT